MWATWPLVGNLFSSLPASGDSYQHAWMLWWLKEQLVSFQNPYYTEDLFAPVGSYLAYGPLMPLVGAVMSPITAALGPGVARNLASLVIPVVSSYVAYRVAMRFGLTRAVAVITGGLYGFSAMLAWRAGTHLNLAAGAIFAPLALLSALRYYHDQTRWNAIVLGMALGAAALVDQQTAIFAAFLAMGYLAAVHIRDRVHPHVWALPLLLAVITGVLVASPQLVMTFRQDAVSESTDVSVLAANYKAFNSSLLAMISPSPNLRLAPWGADEIIYNFERGEGIPAFGWGLLALAVSGLVLARQRLLAIGLLGAFAIGAVLALGPELTFSNQPFTPLSRMYRGQEMSYLMPYTWLMRVPGLDEIRVAARFTQLALLPAALLAGMGLQALMRSGRAAKTVALSLVALAVLEAGWPITHDTDRVPLKRDELYAPVKAESGDSIVVDIPLGFLSGLGDMPGPDASGMEGMYRGTEHGHPIAIGYLARLSQDRVDALLGHRFYLDILTLQGITRSFPEEMIQPPDPRAGMVDAREMGVGWVVIWPGHGVSPEVRRYIRMLGFVLVRRVDDIELYRAPAAWTGTDGR